MKSAGQWAQALVFPVLIAALVAAGSWFLRPDPPAPIQSWFPTPASVSYVEFEGDVYSLQQGPVATHGHTIAPDIVLSMNPQEQLYRLEVNAVADEEPDQTRVTALTFAVTDTISLQGVEMSFGSLASRPAVPVISDSLLAGDDWSGEVTMRVRDEGFGEINVTVTSTLADVAERPDCVASTVSLELAGRLITLDTTWCKGRGVVDYTFPFADSAGVSTATGTPAPPTGTVPDADVFNSWPVGPVEATDYWVALTSLQGSTEINLDAATMMATRADGVALYGLVDTVVAIKLRPPTALEAWGDVLWAVRSDGRVVDIATTEGWTFVAEASGHLTGVSPAGGIHWRHRLADSASAIEAHDGRLIVHTYDGRVASFDPRTGEELWSHYVGQLADPVSLAVAHDLIVAATAQSVHAYDDEGNELFSWPVASMALDATAERVYLIEAGMGLVALNRDGRVLWRKPQSASDVSLLATDRGVVAVDDLTAQAYDPDGNRHWSADGDFEYAMAAADGATALVTGSAIYLISEEGELLGTWNAASKRAPVLTLTSHGLFGQNEELYR